MFQKIINYYETVDFFPLETNEWIHTKKWAYGGRKQNSGPKNSERGTSYCGYGQRNIYVDLD